MGKTKLTPQKLAFADALARQGFTHEQIARELGGGISRSAITYALNQRKNPFPDAVKVVSAEIVERAAAAAQRAIARELRRIADEMDRGIPAP